MQEPFAQLLERTFSNAKHIVIYRLIRSLQPVRHSAADPLPTDTLQRTLDAAWYGPSVGEQARRQVILITSGKVLTASSTMICGGGYANAFHLPGFRSMTMTALNVRVGQEECKARSATATPCVSADDLSLEGDRCVE
jgi:hypothetical protein